MHSPELRPFATFQAESPYAEAFATGLRDLHFRRDLKQFGATEALAAHVAADHYATLQRLHMVCTHVCNKIMHYICVTSDL